MIIRTNKNKNYTCMSNYHLRDKKLSLKAKGLLTIILSLPDDWDYSIQGIVQICKEGETAVKSCLKELKEHGYLEIVRESTSNGFRYIYNIYEEPQNQEVESPKVESPKVENPPMGNPTVGNQGQLNTNKLNTNNILKEKNIKKEKQSVLDELVTDEELKDKLKEYMAMRKLMKAPMTDYAVKLLVNKLNRLSPNKAEQMQMIDNAITSSWKSVYPLKGDQKKPETRGTDRNHNFSELERRLTRR